MRSASKKRAPAVPGPVHHDQLRVETGAFIRTLELVGLVDRHLRVLIAVQQEQRRIAGVDLEYRARESRELFLLVREPAEQCLERGLADTEPYGVDWARIVSRSDAPK